MKRDRERENQVNQCHQWYICWHIFAATESIMVTKLDYHSNTNELESHWVPNTFVQQLSKDEKIYGAHREV